MAIKVQSEFIRKGTVRCIVYVYDDDEALVAATSVAISIVDPDGTVVEDETNMPATATGVYEYFYETTTSVIEGDYQVECDILDGSYHTYAHSHFTLVSGINE